MAQARLLVGPRRDPRHGPAAQAARLADAGHRQGATHRGLRGAYVFGGARVFAPAPADYFCVDGGAGLGDRGPANDPDFAPRCAGFRLACRLRGDVSDAAAVRGAALAAAQATGLKARFCGLGNRLGLGH
jgi:hypothetical protein